MKRHTTINIDTQLVADARAILGTHATSETVHAALDEVVRAKKRAMLLTLPNDLTPEGLRELRSTRFVGDPR